MEQERRQRRHPGHGTELRTVSDFFFPLIWHDPRAADGHIRQMTLKFAGQILVSEGFLS